MPEGVLPLRETRVLDAHGGDGEHGLRLGGEVDGYKVVAGFPVGESTPGKADLAGTEEEEAGVLGRPVVERLGEERDVLAGDEGVAFVGQGLVGSELETIQEWM